MGALRHRFASFPAPVLGVGAGLLAAGLLAVGLLVSLPRLPEWSLGELQDRDVYDQRYRRTAREVGILLEGPDPRISLASRTSLGDPRVDSASPLHSAGCSVGDEVLVEVRSRGTWRDGSTGDFVVGYTPAGEPVLAFWHPTNSLPAFPAVRSEPGSEEEVQAFAAILAPEGAELGVRTTVAGLTAATVLLPLEGVEPPAYIEIIDPAGPTLGGFRRPGAATEEGRDGPFSNLGRSLLSTVPGLLFFLSITALFLAFLGRRRIDLVNAGILAGLTLLVLVSSALGSGAGGLHLLEGLLVACAAALWVFLLWSTAESWWRSLEPDRASSFDALRGGWLGPRGGHAILWGLAAGAALAGLRLGLLAAAGALPDLRAVGLSVPVPVLGTLGNPVTDGIRCAAVVLLAAVLGLRCLPRRWGLAAAALGATVATLPLPIEPFGAAVLAGSLLTGGLLAVFCRFELTGLLVAAVGMYTWPAVILAARHLDWMPGTFALTATGVLTLASVGVTGLRRSEEDEMRRMAAPAFVRRLADERRLQHEMGLLARMQLGLLPARLPMLPGWEISARSLLATEVGGDLYDFVRDDSDGLWVAAGDVSGHGYSCAIVHAMTKAALASLVADDRTPAEVLSEVDRVLRSVHFERAFTSLTLLRLDPASGRGLLANAGHPYPLLCAAGRVREVEAPGLPLGQGPSREYRDHALELPPGGCLVLCSDGLFEATNADVVPYGFERPRRLLENAARWPSNEILEMLLADWRRHRGAVRAADDTTVVVLKRLSEVEL